MYRIRHHAPRAALALALAAAIALAGALMPGLPGFGPAATPTHANTGTALTISSVAITSTAPGGDSVYATGDTITVTVTFGAGITSQTSGAVAIVIGANTRSAAAGSFTCGASSTAIPFSYQVVSGDLDTDGITVATTGLSGTWTTSANHNCGTGQTHNHTSPALPNTLANAQSSHAVNTVDYDTDDDGLIEIDASISGVDQLHLMTFNSSGDGVTIENSYYNYAVRSNGAALFNTAYPNRKTNTPNANGCPASGCIGYELTGDITLDTNDDGENTNADGHSYTTFWGIRPTGNSWAGILEGNGHTISYLHVYAQQPYTGMFAQMSGGEIRNLGLVNATASRNDTSASGLLVGLMTGGTITNCYTSGGSVANTTAVSPNGIGGLVGEITGGTIRDSWSSAAATSGTYSNASVGGLVGDMTGGSIVASYATGRVSGGQVGGSNHPALGGLVGQQTGGSIVASYATGDVGSATDQVFAGGLIGAQHGGSVSASYATGVVAAVNDDLLGGLTPPPRQPGTITRTGRYSPLFNSSGSITDSYWDTDASGIAADSPAAGRGTGLTTAELQGTTDYTGIYASWNHNTDGVAGADDPWYFGTTTQYPHLQHGLSLSELLEHYGATVPPAAADYDDDDNGLIDIYNLQQLDAVRYDLNGNGGGDLTDTDSLAYREYSLAFPGFIAGMGCPSGCDGYELRADLDFLGSHWAPDGGGGLGMAGGVGQGWVPIGAALYHGLAEGNYTGDFRGNGHTISNLYINLANVAAIRQLGLFRVLQGGDIDGVGLPDADLTLTYTTDHGLYTTSEVGALAAWCEADVHNSYATGNIRFNGGGDSIQVRMGGLIGATAANTALAGLWSAVNLVSDSDSTVSNDPDYAGGIVGLLNNNSTLLASYATSSIAAPGGRAHLGGLAGYTNSGGSITASYAAGALRLGDTPSSITGNAFNNAGVSPLRRGVDITVTDSYYNSDTYDATTANAQGEAKTTAELQMPTEYGSSADGDIYADWNVDVDADTSTGDASGNDDPWDFGNASQYPILKFPGDAGAAALQRQPQISYDTDADGLLEISSLAQLDAIRYDLDGNGRATANDRAAYRTAFPNAAGVCPVASGCSGYELMADLDFAGSAYAAAPGWTPLGVDAAGAATAYTAVFDGNNRTISNLLIELTTTTTAGGSYVGLFGQTSGTIRNVGLVNPGVTNTRTGGGAFSRTAALAGVNAAGGVISDSWVDGGAVTVSDNTTVGPLVGCLVGYSVGAISDSRAGCAINASGSVAGATVHAGGIVGYAVAGGAISDSHATGAVTVSGASGSNAGGLAGRARDRIANSYAAGAVTSSSTHTTGHVGGLVGFADGTGGSITGSHASGAVQAATSQNVGGLVGRARVDITSSYATGSVTSSAADDDSYAGGLVGRLDNGDIKASYALGNTTAVAADYVGGLVGHATLSTTQVIQAVYARGSVSRTSASDGGNVGGLIGVVDSGAGAEVTAAYASGAVSNADTTTPGAAGGLVGAVAGSNTTPIDGSHWATDDTGQPNSAGEGASIRYTGHLASDLQGAASYGAATTDVFYSADWNLDLDSVSGNDDPWNFGSSSQYPILTFGHDVRSIATQRGQPAGTVDYDANDNNLIDIGGGLAGLHQLNAVRYDLAGVGDAGATGSAAAEYLEAFPNLLYGMGCPTGCQGYELTADLDFDDNGDGAVDGDDEYGNWVPIGQGLNALTYRARFVGNGHTIANLTITSATVMSGLFGQTGDSAVITGVGLPQVNITTSSRAGALAGTLRGTAYANWSSGSVSSSGGYAGGLIGAVTVGDADKEAVLSASWSSATVSVTGGTADAGGLVGRVWDTVNYSYAIGAVTNAGSGAALGLIGSVAGSEILNDNYWDEDTSGISAASTITGVTGQETDDLQTPTNADAYDTGSIYEDWNIDLDGDGNADDPWDFGTDSEYPVLKFGYSAAGIAAQRPLDYDDNDNGLIEITTPAQLDAVRYDLQGDGAAAAADRAAYRAAFANAEIGMGCDPAPPADGCSGYELKANIDLAGYPNWDPIGGFYNATFNGQGYTISNLAITSGTKNNVGLFSILQRDAVVEKVALVDVDIAESHRPADYTPPRSILNVGALAGQSWAETRYSYSTGRIAVNITETGSAAAAVQAGGLIGTMNDGSVVAGSWADVAVTVASSSGRTADDFVGGLVGYQFGVPNSVSSTTETWIVASYAKGAVSVGRADATAGGLVGALDDGNNVIVSYSSGAVSSTDAGATLGGLVGSAHASAVITDSYFDHTVNPDRTPGTQGKATTALQGTLTYTGDFATWNTYDVDDADADGYWPVAGLTNNPDAPWYFGTANEYPILQFEYNASSISRQQGVDPVNSYDTNGNNLIEVSSLAQLNAIRYDLDGDGNPSNIAAYLGAFRGPLAGMGCPLTCQGYELAADLNFDTDGNGMVDGDDPDSYASWTPIGDDTTAYTGNFQGNGRTISNLTITATDAYLTAGLFGSATGTIEGVGLPEVDIETSYTSGTAGEFRVGPLVGHLHGGGVVRYSWATGEVVGLSGASSAISIIAGGLVGKLGQNNQATIAGSWSSASVVSTNSSAPAQSDRIGGLVGRMHGASGNRAVVTASYATGRVTANRNGATPGGLIGSAGQATVNGSYALGWPGNTGVVIGGLVGSGSSATVNASYWDTTVWTGTSTAGSGQSRNLLQSTDAYTSIYADWNTYDVDGETGADAPWNFLAANQYPILTLGHSAASIAAQTNPQNTELLNIAKPANVDEVVRVGDAWTLEIQPTVVSVDLPRTAFTVRSTAADAVVVTDIDPLPGDGTPDAWTPADYTGGNTMIGLTPALSETPSEVTVRVTSPNGLSTQDYMVTVLRIFCPKAEITGPANMVGEGGSADFTILVCGTTTEPVIVSWAVDTAASTADGEDLGRALTGTITVPTGDDREATLSFPITDDDTPEPSETITVRITGVSGGTTRIDMRPAMATIALSDPSLTLRAPEGTGTGGAGDTADAPLTAQSILVLTEGAGRSYSLRLATETRESVTIVIHSNHEGVTTTPDRVTFNPGNWQTPQRVTVNAAQDGDDNHDRATLTHILTDEEGGLLEIIDRIPLFVTDTDPPDDDDIC